MEPEQIEKNAHLRRNIIKTKGVKNEVYMIPKPFIPCKDFSELLRTINSGKKVSIIELSRLHFHLLECKGCRLLLNDNARKTLYGEEYEE